MSAIRIGFAVDKDYDFTIHVTNCGGTTGGGGSCAPKLFLIPCQGRQTEKDSLAS